MAVKINGCGAGSGCRLRPEREYARWMLNLKLEDKLARLSGYEVDIIAQPSRRPGARPGRFVTAVP
ncbi:MAG: hypothetical protein KatS3mg014_2619 [Actinomycetota bacterium]|nr:MAG: hypothetical protein KatS3mg014_2619 [Actinomycetota bacterium]